MNRSDIGLCSVIRCRSLQRPVLLQADPSAWDISDGGKINFFISCKYMNKIIVLGGKDKDEW